MTGKCNLSKRVLLILGLVLLFAGEKAFGAKFPEKPIKIIVNYPAGSAIDSEARGIAPYLQKYLGVRIIIENWPGANGKIGLIKAWKATPDGYTWLIHSTTMGIIVESLINPEYQLIDFTHVSSLSRSNNVVVVNSEKWKTFAELVAAAKKDTLVAGLPGIGSTAHLNGLILMDRLGIKVNWVPFDSSGANITALAGKHVDFIVAGSNVAIRSLVATGKLRTLFVMSDSKDIVFPEIPLPKEQGYNLNFISLIRGVDGPPKIPANILKIFEGAFAKAVKEPAYLAWAKVRMIEVFTQNTKEYKELIASQRKEIDKYREAFETVK